MEHKIPPQEQWTQQYLSWISALISTKKVLGKANYTTFIKQQINSEALFQQSQQYLSSVSAQLSTENCSESKMV